MSGKELIAGLRERFPDKVRDIFEKSKTRIYATVDPGDIREVVVFLFKGLGLRFNIASAVDAFDAYEILYHFAEDSSGVELSVRVFLKDKNDPHIDSITTIIKGAEWIEREMHELFGIEFDGHPNMKPLLLADDWPKGVYPLRKEYKVEQRDDR